MKVLVVEDNASLGDSLEHALRAMDHSVEPLVEEGGAIPIMTWGALDDSGNLVRDPTFPDLPHFAEVYEMVHGAAPSGAAFDAWKAFFTAGVAAQKMI